MARKSQAERINLLCGVVEQLAIRFSTLLALVLPDDPEPAQEVQEFADMARQLADENFVSLVMDGLDSNGQQQ